MAIIGEEMRPALRHNLKVNGGREGQTDMLIAIPLRLFCRGVKMALKMPRSTLIRKKRIQNFIN